MRCRSVVANYFAAFSARWEGYTNYPYPDVKGLVTVGRGNMIPNLSAMYQLPWRIGGKDGLLADKTLVTAEWCRLRAISPLERNEGGGHFAEGAKLFLTDAVVDGLTLSKASEMCDSLAKELFPEWDEWPACAQLGTLSLSWGYGEHLLQGPAPFPKFVKAAQMTDWATCSEECKLSTVGNPGVTGRNGANEYLFRSALMIPLDKLPNGCGG